MKRFAAACLAAGLSSPAFAAFNSLVLLQAIPTLDEVGLGLLVALVGASAGWAIGRRKTRRQP